MIFKLGEKKDCGIIIKSVEGGKFEFVTADYKYVAYKTGEILEFGGANFNSTTGRVWHLLEPTIYGSLIFTVSIQPLLLDTGLADSTKDIEIIKGEALVKI